jgi:alanine racemase
MLSWVEIDAGRLKANIEAIRGLLGSRTKLMVVVKANAYGHGMNAAAPVAAATADWLGVNSLDEALQLSELGLHKPIAILGHTEVARVADIVRNGYRQVVYRLDVARALSRTAEAHQTIAHVHLKIETGTNRQGIQVPDLEAFVGELSALPALDIEGIYTHFANIEDTLDPSFAQFQIQRFHEARMTLARLGIQPAEVHASATAGALLYPETDFSMVRVGIGAYGIWPSRETQLAARERGRLIPLSPVLTWKTRVAQVKKVNAGDYIGYGLTYQARRAMELVVVPVGYYDGYDRRLSNSGRALLRDQMVPVVGRVAMNMMMLDATDTGAELDDEVVLIGRQGNSEIRVEEVAEKCGSIPYEVLSRINPLIPRVVLGKMGT